MAGVRIFDLRLDGVSPQSNESNWIVDIVTMSLHKAIPNSVLWTQEECERTKKEIIEIEKAWTEHGKHPTIYPMHGKTLIIPGSSLSNKRPMSKETEILEGYMTRWKHFDMDILIVTPSLNSLNKFVRAYPKPRDIVRIKGGRHEVRGRR